MYSAKNKVLPTSSLGCSRSQPGFYEAQDTSDERTEWKQVPRGRQMSHYSGAREFNFFSLFALLCRNWTLWFFSLITDLTKHLANCCIIPQCLNQSWMKCSQTWIRCCVFFFFLGSRGIRFYLNAYWDKSWTMFCQAFFFSFQYIFSHHCVHALRLPLLPGNTLLMELVAMLVNGFKISID